MKAKHIKMVFFGLVAIAGFSAAVMLLWNWLIPSIFGLTAINFWQALGLLVLIRILFGSFGGQMMHGRKYGKMHGNNPIRDKWMQMTDEERKEFIKKRKECMNAAHFGHGHFFGGGFGFDTESESKKDSESFRK